MQHGLTKGPSQDPPPAVKVRTMSQEAVGPGGESGPSPVGRTPPGLSGDSSGDRGRPAGRVQPRA